MYRFFIYLFKVSLFFSLSLMYPQVFLGHLTHRSSPLTTRCPLELSVPLHIPWAGSCSSKSLFEALHSLAGKPHLNFPQNRWACTFTYLQSELCTGNGCHLHVFSVNTSQLGLILREPVQEDHAAFLRAELTQCCSATFKSRLFPSSHFGSPYPGCFPESHTLKLGGFIEVKHFVLVRVLRCER